MATQQTPTWAGHYFAFSPKHSEYLNNLPTRSDVQASLLSAHRILHFRLTASDAAYMPVKQHNADGTASENFFFSDVDNNWKIANVTERAQDVLGFSKEQGAKQVGFDTAADGFCFEYRSEDEGYSGDVPPETYGPII